jgi:outer membrane protein assembly factor BamB
MTQPSTPGRRWFRQVVLPLLLLGLPVALWFLPAAWAWADLDPGALFAMNMVRMWGVMLSPLLLLLWLFVFSGFAWLTRFALLVVAIGLVTGVILSAEWDVTGNLGMTVRRWRWQPKAADLLAQHRSEHADASGLPAIDLTVDPADSFPRYRGGAGDGSVRDLKLASDWAASPPKQLWLQPVGGGFAGFAVAGNVAITIEQRGDDEAVVCYDRATGRERWAHAYPAAFRHPTGSGPRATPTIADGDVYSMGATGILVCLDGKTGKEKWTVDILEDNKAKGVTWGMTSSPLVLGELVIVNPGIDPDNNAGQALAAYRRDDGKRAWATGKYQAGYSSPQRARLAGREQVLLFDGGGLAGFEPKTGKELWRHPWQTFQDMNIIQPLVLSGDRVFISSETNNGCALLQVKRSANGFAVEELWANKNLCSKFANPVATGGHIYGLSTGYLVCLDAQTGERRWRGKHYGHGQVLAVGAALIVLSDQGALALVAADPERFRELGRLEVFKDKTWNTPALAGRQLFVRNDTKMACYELAGQKKD